MNDFWKYHGLGNDYLVMEPTRFQQEPKPEAIAKICDRHMGVGADGVLWGPIRSGSNSTDEPMALVIYNADGSQGEKSGNGLRIFARHVWERKLATQRKFLLDTAGGRVEAEILREDGSRVAIEMGSISFESKAIPMTGENRTVLEETLNVDGRDIVINGATVGNPHCVVKVEEPTPELARELGPKLENHPAFPNRTNVQFMRAIGPQEIQIEIWERGSGYTLASGTSSCAAASVAVKLGLVKPPVTVHTQGGLLLVSLEENDNGGFEARLEGDVASVLAGNFTGEFLSDNGLVRMSSDD